MAFTATKLGIDVTKTSTDQLHELGLRASDELGNEYCYIQANGAIAAEDIVTIDGSYDCAPLGGAGVAWAVAIGAIADNSYGWVQTKGVVTAACETGVLDNDQLGHIAGASGYLQKAVAGTAGDGTRGKALSAESSNSATVFLF